MTQNNADNTDSTVCACVISAGGTDAMMNIGRIKEMNAPNANITMLLLRDIRIKLILINVESVGTSKPTLVFQAPHPKGHKAHRCWFCRSHSIPELNRFIVVFLRCNHLLRHNTEVHVLLSFRVVCCLLCYLGRSAYIAPKRTHITLSQYMFGVGYTNTTARRTCVILYPLLTRRSRCPISDWGIGDRPGVFGVRSLCIAAVTACHYRTTTFLRKTEHKPHSRFLGLRYALLQSRRIKGTDRKCWAWTHFVLAW